MFLGDDLTDQVAMESLLTQIVKCVDLSVIAAGGIDDADTVQMESVRCDNTNMSRTYANYE